jgi:hypothetical protein
MTLPSHFHELLLELSNPENACNNAGYTEPNGGVIMHHELNLCMKGNGNMLLRCIKLLRNKI